MKTFLQFITEQKHSHGDVVHDWGVIHPKTGKLISGVNHPSATTHTHFKKELHKKNPDIHPGGYADYIHYTSHEGLTTHTRSNNGVAHHGLKKALKNLPAAKNYSHDNESEKTSHDFSNERDFHKHVNSIAV